MKELKGTEMKKKRKRKKKKKKKSIYCCGWDSNQQLLSKTSALLTSRQPQPTQKYVAHTRTDAMVGSEPDVDCEFLILEFRNFFQLAKQDIYTSGFCIQLNI